METTSRTRAAIDANKAFSHVLHPVKVREMVQSWLNEDASSFEYGGFVVGEENETALLLCKAPGVLAGVPFFESIFRELGCTVTWLVSEGDYLDPQNNSGTPISVAEVIGKARHVLIGERVALNCLSRASGIATRARRLRDASDRLTWHGEVAGTRKTTPGFRMVEKYALLIGGVSTHRYDLSSMIMLKDNHIWSAGNITQAVVDARRVAGFSTLIEVECRSVREAEEAATAGADIIMLDNFSPQALAQASSTLKATFPRLLIESSGGITESNSSEYMLPSVDIISLSCLTQGYDVVDFSLKIQKQGHDPTNPTVTL